MLRRCNVVLRIGTHLDPKYAGFGSERVEIKVVAGSDLKTEHGYNEAKGRREVRYETEKAFREQVAGVVEGVRGAGVASVANAVKLIGAGEVGEGVEMAGWVDTKAGLAADDILKLLAELSLPAYREAWTAIHDGNTMEGYKQTGAHRGYERTREAEHLYTLLEKKTDKTLDTAPRLEGYNHLLHVYTTAGYKHCLAVPDYLYDRMFFKEIQPSLRTYEHVLLSLGLTTRMAEFDALWSWLSSYRSNLTVSTYKTVMNSLCEAERFIDVEREFKDIAERGTIIPDHEVFAVLIRSIYEFSRHAGGAIPASEEKKLVFIPTWLRQHGVHFTDLTPFHQQLVTSALERWTFRRGLAKTTEPMLEQRAYEYDAWNEGQRWSHISQDEMNTSMIEAGVRKMRGDTINERMRLDVQKGGGRGVIYPEPAHLPATRFDPHLATDKSQVTWDRFGVNSAIHGRAPRNPTDDEVSRKVQFAKRSSVAKPTSGSGIWGRR